MQTQYTHSIQDAINNLQALPESMRQEAFHYIDFLRTRSTENNVKAVQKSKKRHAGTAKGVAVFSEDFDAPLADFEDYT